MNRLNNKAISLNGLVNMPIIIEYDYFGGLAKEVTITTGNVPSA